MALKPTLIVAVATSLVSIAGVATAFAQEDPCDTKVESICNSRWRAGCGWAGKPEPGMCMRDGGGTATIRVILKPSSKGWEVRSLQEALVDKGFSVKIDGDYGPATEAAVKEVQKAGGLAKIDGIAGPETRELLAKK